MSGHLMSKIASQSRRYSSQASKFRLLASIPCGTGESNTRRNASHRSWNVVNYNDDLRKAVQFSSSGSMPTIHRPNDVLIRVMASSINPLDIAMTRGYGNVLLGAASTWMTAGMDRITHDRLPLTLGRDFVGQIVSRGTAVQYYKPGDVVWGTVPPYENGAHADFVIASDHLISRKPKNLSNEEAASIPYVGLTAWSALSTFGELTTSNALNKKVLVLGGGGGVGNFAIQLLKHWGAHVITTCSPKSAEFLQSTTEVDQCVDYKQTKEFLSNHEGTFDFILDASTTGAAHNNYEIIKSIMNRNDSAGQAATVFDTKKTMYITLNSPLMRNLDQHGLMGGIACTMSDALLDTLDGLRHGLAFRWAYYLPNPKALAHITDLVERGAIKPSTVNVFDFDHALDAYESFESKPTSGKVVLKCSA